MACVKRSTYLLFQHMGKTSECILLGYGSLIINRMYLLLIRMYLLLIRMLNGHANIMCKMC